MAVFCDADLPSVRTDINIWRVAVAGAYTEAGSAAPGNYKCDRRDRVTHT